MMDTCCGTAEGLTIDELIDRLLSYPMSRGHTIFKDTFLCFYRLFAAPSKVLARLIAQFKRMQSASEPLLVKVRSQLRLIEVIHQWLKAYPGDFALHSTRLDLHAFLAAIAGQSFFAAAAFELQKTLDLVKEDDDTLWVPSNTAIMDEDLTFDSVSPSSQSCVTKIGTKTLSVRGIEEAYGNMDLGSSRAKHLSESSSNLSSSTLTDSYGSSAPSPLDSVEVSRCDDSLLNLTLTEFTKAQWHQFMDTGEQVIANELTLLDRDMLLLLRPRDFLRHVSLPPSQKANFSNLASVSDMIDHFNHIAMWVAHLILLRDKAKHRAKILEKFINVAWVL